MSSAARTYLTPEQYLALEARAEVKHEYDRGRIIAMAGASREHNLIAANIAHLIGNQLIDRPCEAYVADMRVQIDDGRYVYPDVVVACGEPRFADGESDNLLNPTLIVEVLSPSTERRDRGRKFHQYRTIESLQEYLMIAQDEVRIERYTRRGGEWVFTEVSDPAALFRLDSIGCEIAVREVYAKVAFPAEPQG